MAVLAASTRHFLVPSPSTPQPSIVRLEAQAVPSGPGACASPAVPGPACAAEAPRRWPPLPAAVLAWPGAAPAHAPIPAASPLPAQPQPLSGVTAARPTPSSGRRPVTLSRRAVAVVQGRPLSQAQQPLPSAQQVLPISPRLAPAPAPLPSPAPAPVVAAGDFESRQTALVLGNPQVLERCAGLLFRKSDLNRDGRLSLDELAQLLPFLHEQLGLRPPEHGDRLARARMRKFDRNGDGVLGEAEFVELYRWMLYRRYEELNPPKFRRGDVVGCAHRGVPSQYYEIGKQLGAGAFGVVSEVTHRQTHLQCVMKTVNKDKAAASGTPVALLKQEIDALSLLDHPNILRLFEWYNDHHNIYMLMDACKGGELLELILEIREGNGAMPEAWVSRIFRQTLEAIGYCHTQGVMHKDLKFENVMLREKVTRASSYHDIHAVVIDVGLAELFGPQHGRGSRSRERAGSLATMAPEVIQGDFAYKCDIWSLGCMLFAIFNSRPFNIPGPNGQGQMLYMYPFYPTPTQEDPMGAASSPRRRRMAAVAAAERPPMMALELPVGPEVSDVDAMVQRLRTPRSVDEQVKESADKLCETKAWQKRVDEEVGCLESMPTLQSTSQWHPCSKRPGDSFHWLKLLQDPQFLELCEKAEKELTPEEEEAPLRLDWRRHCRRGIRALLEQLRLTQDPKVAERQLRAAHRWYQLQAGAFSTSHSTADTRAEKSGRRPPSPCFHDPPALDVTLMPGSTRYCAPETAGGLASPSAQPSGRSRPALPSARDRLKCFETRQLVGPPSARRGKAGSCWDGTSERADTPSTSAGGYTARSFPSARTSSRPASAVSLRPPLSARAGPASRPRTASGLRAHSSFESDSFIREPPTPEELRMEERWLAARNREVVEQIAGEERRAALRDWSERRARVEEEIARNHEVARFQSDLPRRGYELPADAHEDIDLALGAAERGSGGRRPPAAPELSAEPSAGSSVASGGAEPAEAQSREDLQVRFAEEPEVAVAGEEGLVPQQPPARPALTPRLAQLRRIHARYLQRPQGGAAQSGLEEGQEEAAPPSVGEESQPEPLSTHAAGRPEDGSDVVAAVCERWRESHAPELLVESGSSMTHRQMRYQQLMEVEQVKRAFTRRQTPLDEAALESALVAPSRGLCADATPMSTGPGGMRNPFAERHGKKKPKAKRRRKSTGKGSASSRSPPAGPRRARSAKR